MTRKSNTSDEINNNVVYGYARVSTEKQSLTRQITNLTKYNPNIKIYQEKYSGRHINNRAELNKLLSIVKKGDCIIFDSVSRMSRNSEEGFALYKELYQKGINLVFLNESYINTDVYRSSIENTSKAFNLDIQINDSATNELVTSIMQAIQKYTLDLLEKQFKAAFEQAQKELDDFRERVKQGLRERKAKGLPLGSTLQHRERKDKKDKLNKIMNLSRAFNGKFTDKQIIEMLKVSSVTLCKYKREIKEQIEKGLIKL